WQVSTIEVEAGTRAWEDADSYRRTRLPNEHGGHHHRISAGVCGARPGGGAGGWLRGGPDRSGAGQHAARRTVARAEEELVQRAPRRAREPAIGELPPGRGRLRVDRGQP